MAWGGVITNAGAVVIENYISSGVEFFIDTVKTGTGTKSSASEMRAATDMVAYADTGSIVGKVEKDNGVQVQVSIPASSSRYVMKEIGLFATLEDESQVMIAYYNDDSIGVEIPDVENFPDFNYILFFLLDLLNASDLNITVDSDAYITIGSIENSLNTLPNTEGKVLDARQGKVLDDKKVNVYQGIENHKKGLVVDDEGNVTPTTLDFVDVNQGVENAGKFLIVNSSGVVVPTEVPFANGVNF